MKRTIIPLALTILSASVAAQTPTWSVEFLGEKPTEVSSIFPVAVNDAGVVVGNGYENGYKRAWVARSGIGVELLPFPPDTTFSNVYDINNDGVVAGWLYLESGLSRAVIWVPGDEGYELVYVPLGPDGQQPFDARAINDRGDVVGKLGVLSGSYVWDMESVEVEQIPTGTFPVVPDDLNEQRQIVGDSYRMDLDDLVLENLGSPTGTPYSYIYTRFHAMNDAGECAGYSVVGTSGWPYLPVRYSDGSGWTLFASFPLIAAGALDIAATGDTVYQIGTFGTYVYVNGVGSIGLGSLVDPSDSEWDVADSFVPAISRSGRLGLNGFNTSTGQAGIVLLSPRGFEDLGGGSPGALGTPVLTGYGSMVPGEPVRLRLASSATSSVSFLAWASASTPLPLFGGTLFANPVDFIVSFPTDALGRFDVTFGWPAFAPGATFYLQVGVVDPEASGSVALSNALRAVSG